MNSEISKMFNDTIAELVGKQAEWDENIVKQIIELAYDFGYEDALKSTAEKDPRYAYDRIVSLLQKVHGQNQIEDNQ